MSPTIEKIILVDKLRMIATDDFNVLFSIEGLFFHFLVSAAVFSTSWFYSCREFTLKYAKTL